MTQGKSEVRDGMRIDWEVPIEMDDGLVVMADIFRPLQDGKYPVLLTYGPYGKGLAFQELYTTAWEIMCEKHPDVPAGSTNQYQNWEVVDPEKWVPDGYVCARIDSRGCGRSPGVLDLWSARETKDLYDCIEWAGVQSWSNGKVGLNGISYYAMNQWQAAAIQPPHLAAICPWEGAADWYRDVARHGGILTDFLANWFDMQVLPVQHGYGERGYRSRVTGELVAGPETLSDDELEKNRRNIGADCRKREMMGDYYSSRTPDFSKIEVPLFSAANWGGQPLHPRGNFEGFVQSGSKEKWLEVHGIEHWTHFYTDYGRKQQKMFFEYTLKGENNGWKKQPRVMLQVRHPGEVFKPRAEKEWPLKRTKWTKFYLDPGTMSFGPRKPAKGGKLTYEAMGDGVTFVSEPLNKEMEITGPSAAKLRVSSSTADADIFLVVRVFAPDFKEVTFQGALDPNTPIAQGWLRASHRKLDKKLSKKYRPWHTHDKKQPLKPGKAVDLDIEIWPTCIVVPAGYRIGLSVRGRDYVYPGGGGSRLSNMKNPFTGVGPFTHTDPKDRPAKIFDGDVTLHFGKDREPYVLLPIIPSK